MPDSSDHERPPLVVAMQWVHQITTIGLEMALPAGAGAWLDDRYGTSPWFLVGGALLGFAAAMSHLIQIARRSQQENSQQDNGSRKGR